MANSKTFWKTVKPLFTDKILTGDNIVLVENREIINESYKIDKRDSAGAILSGLSKVFDCLDHFFMLTKLHAYGM